MSTPDPVLQALSDAQGEVAQQRDWGQSRSDNATEFLLTVAELAIAQFNALNVEVAALDARLTTLNDAVTALDARVVALENPPPP